MLVIVGDITLTVIVTAEKNVPQTFLLDKEYVVFIEGVTVIEGLFDPVLHVYVWAPEPESVALLPLQINAEDGVTITLFV